MEDESIVVPCGKFWAVNVLVSDFQVVDWYLLSILEEVSGTGGDIMCGLSSWLQIDCFKYFLSLA